MKRGCFRAMVSKAWLALTRMKVLGSTDPAAADKIGSRVVSRSLGDEPRGAFVDETSSSLI